MPGATWRIRPQADRAASRERLGRRAVSSSDRPVSGPGQAAQPVEGQEDDLRLAGHDERGDEVEHALRRP